MVQWEDPAVEARLAIISVDVTFLLLGLYGWEYFQSLDVEYAIVRMHMNFRWALIPYLVGRISLLTTLILLTFQKNMAAASLPCQPAFVSAAAFGSITVACSSTNLLIRTWLIWKNSRLIHVLLLFVTLGHWTLLALSVAEIKTFISNGVCVFYLTQPTVTAGTFAYTMCYDFLVFMLSVVKLSRQPSKSRLSDRLRSQGLSYFAVAVVANILPTVFTFVGSASMAAITIYFAMTASTIVSCRVVRSLLDLCRPQSDRALGESVQRDPTVLTTELERLTQLASTAPTNV